MTLIERNKQRKRLTITDGVTYYPNILTKDDQTALLGEINKILTAAPLFKPRMPKTGKPFSVDMSNCGDLGWLSDREMGYRYEQSHPETNHPWPPMPEMLTPLWYELTGYPAPPEACLINYYTKKARMGLHRDDDEIDQAAPILSLSLGDSAWFRIGGLARNDPTSRLMLKSGDIICMSGPARYIYHAIDRILPGTSDLIAKGGRYNLTLRRVNPPTKNNKPGPVKTLA